MSVLINQPTEMMYAAKAAINASEKTMVIESTDLLQAAEYWYKDQKKIEYLESLIIRMGRGK